MPTTRETTAEHGRRTRVLKGLCVRDASGSALNSLQKLRRWGHKEAQQENRVSDYMRCCFLDAGSLFFCQAVLERCEGVNGKTLWSVGTQGDFLMLTVLIIHHANSPAPHAAAAHGLRKARACDASQERRSGRKRRSARKQRT
jgi:hypothetical protein